MSSQDENRNPFADDAHLGKPINLGISGIQKVIGFVKDSTPEVRDLIFNECELLFECRACRNFFRQLPNFLHHKREFCKKHYCESMMAFTAEDVPEEIVIVQPESPKSNDNDNEIDNLEEKADGDDDSTNTEEINLLTSIPKIYQPNLKLTTSQKLDVKPTIGKSSASLFYTKCLNHIERKANTAPKKSLISLDTIQSNPNAKYQTMKDISQNEKLVGTDSALSAVASSSLAEIRQQIEEARTAVITPEEMGNSLRRQRHDSDGSGSAILRLRNRIDCSVDDLTCLTCRTRYQTAKTLDFHMRTVHSDTRIYYPCPFCNTSFVQIWSVMRHITSIHKKTKEQSYKMKDTIKSRGFRKNPAVNNVVNQNDAPSTSYAVKTDNSNGHNVKKTNKNSFPGETINSICKRQSLLKKSLMDSTSKNSSGEKSNKNSVIHVCSKCGRSFARKSSQATHEKYCSHGNDNKNEKAEEEEGKEEEEEDEEEEGEGEGEGEEGGDEKDQNVEFVKEIEESREGSNRPKRNAKKKQEADFIPLMTTSYSRTNISKQSQQSENNLLQKLNMTSATLEKKVQAIINTKKLRCLKCNRRFSTFSNLRRHAAIHIGWNRYKCKYCDYQSYNRSDCRSHIRRNHLQGKPSITHVDKFVLDLPPESPPLPSRKISLKRISSPIKMDPSSSTVTVKLTKCNVTSFVNLQENNLYGSDSPDTDSSQMKSSNASVQSNSSPPTPKKAKKSKEQCLYEGNDTGTLKTRSGSYPKADLFGKHLQSKSLDGKIGNNISIKRESSISSDEQPSTSNANLVPTSPSRLKSSMTSKFQKFIYVHDDFFSHLKSKTSHKTQTGASPGSSSQV